MSIDIKNIYCNHFLKNENLKDFCKNTKYDSFSYPPYQVLTSFHIEDTIHYKALMNNDYSKYAEYVKITNQKEHSVEKFLNLLDNFDIKKMKKIEVLYNFEKNKYFVQDGVHRLSILLYKKNIDNSVPLSLLNISFDNKTIIHFKNNLKNTVGISHYNGWGNRTQYGYHSFNIFNFNVLGQRNPKQRLEYIKKYISFYDKSVLDLGCNTGGMLLHLPEIKKGIGIDYDKNCIKSATFMKNTLKYDNELEFIVDDLNTFNIENVKSNNNIYKFDVVFLLSLGSWIKNWKHLYKQIIDNSNIIVFESNNDIEGKPQLDLFLNYNCNIELINKSSTDDITNNFKRKTYIITPLSH